MLNAKTRWGTCDDMAAFLALSLRAIGIPASIDYVPAWANRVLRIVGMW